MKLAVFGATGLAGRHVVQVALDQGHEVTAIARKASGVTLKHERLRVVEADPLKPDTVARAIEGVDAVVHAVGPRKGEPAGTLISQTTNNILAAMKEKGVKRLALVSGYMVGEAKGIGFFGRALVGFFRRLNHALFLDKLLAEQTVQKSDVEWVIVRPPNFDERPSKGNHRVSQDIDMKLVTMSAFDVAAGILDAVTKEANLRKLLEVSY